MSWLDEDMTSNKIVDLLRYNNILTDRLVDVDALPGDIILDYTLDFSYGITYYVYSSYTSWRYSL